MPLDDTATDQELLRAFLEERAQGAFAMLMQRHGAMVWSVCRRMLGQVHDADDAFQAVFLVLVRKAASLRGQANLGPWLYGVAYRTALKQRAAQVKRLAREQQAQPRPEATPPVAAEDLAALDEEIQRLPDRYRQPLVLCLLEGQTREQAAAGLRLPQGTLSSRIASAKQLLAQRLSKRGVALSLAALAAALAPSAAPAACVEATQQAITVASTGKLAGAGVSAPVAALTQEVLNAMFYKQLRKIAAILLSLVTLIAIIVWLALGVQAGDDKDAPPDQERIVGEWKAASVTDGGRRRDGEGHGIIFTKDKLTLMAGKKKQEFPYRLDPTKKPKWIDSKSADGTKDILGIYKFEGKRLIICINEVGDGPRPDRFISEGGTPNDLLMELERK